MGPTRTRNLALILLRLFSFLRASLRPLHPLRFRTPYNKPHHTTRPIMKPLIALGVLAMSAAVSLAQPADKVVLVIHGGAGAEPKNKLTPELDKKYRDGLERALQAGRAALQREGGTSLDAVEAAIMVLEDDPIFNAGR